jgi:uncharacterized protein
MIQNAKTTGIKLLLKMPSLFFGFLLYAVAILLELYSNLGMSPWDVFHMGIVSHSGLTLGQVTQLVGLAVIVLSVFLGVIPGIGSIFNMIFIGAFVDWIDRMGIIRTPPNLPLKAVMLLASVVTTGLATFFYLRVELGAGPRDGLMEGLVKKLDKPVWMIRVSIELSVLIIGFFLGGPVGAGTLVLAIAVGPAVQAAFKIGKYDSQKACHMNFLDLYRAVRSPAVRED